MAARTVQINSFCGGSSKLADSEFLGMEESVNMYPETVTASDTYTTKILKSVEGFTKGTLFGADEIFTGVKAINNRQNESFGLLVVTRDRMYPMDHKVYTCDGNNRIPAANFHVLGDDTIITELPSGLSLMLCGGQIYACDPTQLVIPSLQPIVIPDAFDHAGKIVPTQMAHLNFRVVLNDAESDYIYWSELNRPSDPNDTHAFEQSLTQYAYTKNDGTVVTFADNVFYAPAVGSYVPGSLTTQTVYTSSLNSMKMDFKADKVTALLATDSSLFVFGRGSLQILRWQNSTTAPFAIVAKTSEVGISHPRAAVVIGRECYFVGRGPGGMFGVFAVDESGSVRKVSSTAVDQRLARYNAPLIGITDLYAFSYSYKGHAFFVFSIDGARTGFSTVVMEDTMCFDVVEQTWTDRASFDAMGNRHKWCAEDSVQLNGKPYFVTRTNGGKIRVCEFDRQSSTDRYLSETNADTDHYIQKSRTTGIKYDGINDIVVTSLELVLNSAATTDMNPESVGYNPRVMLQVSTDGGRTWSSELWAYAGKVGQFSWRTRWNGLGRGARFAFRVKMSDPVPFEIATAYMSYLPCGNRV